MTTTRTAPTAPGTTTVALAITDRTAGTHGISAFVVERGAKGFSVAKKENKLGMRASDTAALVFDDCFVPDSNLLGEPGQGFIQAMKVLDGGRISIAALAVAFLLFNLTSRLIIGETASERADELSLVFLTALLVFLMTIRPGLFGKRGDVLLISTGRVSGDKQV